MHITITKYHVLIGHVLTLFLTFSTVGCCHLCNRLLKNDHKVINSTMDEVDRVMMDNPQLAYSLLDDLDYSLMKRRDDIARYALLYTEAQYKNFLPILNDSLIKIAVHYYSKHRNLELLFRSYYYQGCVYSLLGFYNDAAVSFAQANTLIDNIDSDFQKGMLYSRMGDIYYDCCDYYRAENYYMNATTFFGKADKEYYMICAKGYAANCKAQMGDYQSSIDVYNEIIDWAERVDSLNLKNQYLINKYTCLVFCGEMKGTDFFNSISSKDELYENNLRLLILIARYYILNHDNYHARGIIDKAWNIEPTDSVNLLYTEALYYEEMGDLEKAIDYLRQTWYLNKRLVLTKLNQPVIGAQSDYYRAQSELEALKARNRLILFISTFILLLLIVVSTTLIIMNRKRKTNELIRQNLYAIDELTARYTISQKSLQQLNELLKEKTESIENLNERIIDLSSHETINKTRIQQLNSKVREMLRQQYVLPDYLYTRYYEQIDDTKKAERLYKIVKNQIAEFTNSKNIEKLDKMLNYTFGDLMKKLSSPMLGLKEKEMLLLRLVLTDISAKSMAAILNDTNQNINQRKKRLLEKIGRKDPGLLADLIDVLNT